MYGNAKKTVTSESNKIFSWAQMQMQMHTYETNWQFLKEAVEENINFDVSKKNEPVQNLTTIIQATINNTTKTEGKEN